MRYVIVMLLLWLMPLGSVSAQTEIVTVPDVTGLNVPQAAALLNANGLRLGALTGSGAAELPPNTVSGQSIAGGEQAPYGTVVDLSIATESRLRLIYDDNDITLVNQSGEPFPLAGLSFNSNDGSKRFSASDWTPVLEGGDCGQLWSVITRRDPKRLPECDAIMWQGTNDTTRHFWTELAGVDSFSVVRDGIELATCDAAPAGTDPLSCELSVVPASALGANTPYIYFAYTTDTLAIVNVASDQWMPLSTTPIYADDARTPVALTERFDAAETVGDPERLAPEQCLTLGEALPEPCNVIASAAAGDMFWVDGFAIDSATDDSDDLKLCPAVEPGQLAVCMLPR
jgi:hypothetical protein